MAAVRGGEAGRGRDVRPRHDGRHERPARAPRRADGARDHGGVPGRPGDRPPGAPAPLRSRAAATAGARPARAALLRPRADGAGRRARAARRGVARRRGRRGARPQTWRPWPSACCSRSCIRPHERRVGEALREALPDVHVSLSSEVLAEMREYERMSTTVADAYLAPRLSSYLGALAGKTRRGGAAGAPGHAVLRRRRGAGGRRDARRELRALRTGGRRRRRRLRGQGERVREPPDVRHGRHEHRRRARHGRGGADDDGRGDRRRADPPPDGRRPHRLRRRRLDRRGRSAARCTSARGRRAPIPGPWPTGRAARSRR